MTAVVTPASAPPASPLPASPLPASPAGLDAAGFRARFPALGSRVHLASCSFPARSADLDTALTAMLDDLSSAAAWDRFEEQVSAARRAFADLIGADPAQVALVPSASAGAYQVASTLDWGTRPVILTSDAEFPSIAHVWLAQRPRGAEVVFAASGEPAGAGAGTAPDAAAHRYQRCIDGRVKLLSVPLTSYSDGARWPVARIAAMAREHGALTFVDAYQAVGNEPVRVDSLGCDYLVAGSMKYLLGLPGLAFLYVRSPGTADRDPVFTGWFGRVSPFAFDSRRLDFPRRATRYETGTPAVPACYAAAAGLGLIGLTDLAAVRRHVTQLTAHAAATLTAAGEQVRTQSDPAARGAHIGLADGAPAALAAWLAGRNIAVSPRGDVVRLAFHYYNDLADVAELAAQLREYRSR